MLEFANGRHGVCEILRWSTPIPPSGKIDEYLQGSRRRTGKLFSASLSPPCLAARNHVHYQGTAVWSADDKLGSKDKRYALSARQGFGFEALTDELLMLVLVRGSSYEYELERARCSAHRGPVGRGFESACLQLPLLFLSVGVQLINSRM